MPVSFVYAKNQLFTRIIKYFDEIGLFLIRDF